jgi:RNA polymerase subunit RPABC4/transcription elongation factor Spt4
MVGNKPDFMINSEKKTKLNNRQVLGLGFGILIPLWLLVSGYFRYLGVLWMIILPVILYLGPRITKVRDLKYMIANGVLFAVIAILIGGLFMSPALINDNNQFRDGGMFKDAVITPTETGYSVTAEYIGDDLTLTPVAFLMQVEMAGYWLPYGKEGGTETFTGTMFGNTVSYDITANDKLYIMYFYMNDGDGEKVSGSQSPSMFLTEKTSSSEFNRAVWLGTVYIVGVVVILYLMITLFTYAIRSKANKTRDRMIEQGRLYPDGYGRCKECGAIVLPGEISCLKCGAYIDVPKELRPHKVDYFECEQCGAEVPEDAERCPKCNAEFDGFEVEVVRTDGTVEVVQETFECPDCKSEVPISSKTCPVCGRTFRK